MSRYSQRKPRSRMVCSGPLIRFMVFSAFVSTLSGVACAAEVPIKPKRQTKVPENLTVQEMHRREQDIITREWRLVHPLLSKLADSRLSAPEYIPTPERRGRKFCEALQNDLVAGNYALVRKPEISAAQVGTKAFVQAYKDAENDCSRELRGSDRFAKAVEKTPYNVGRHWISPINYGIVRWEFNYEDSHLLFYYETNACRNKLDVPNWPRKGTVKFIDPPENYSVIGNTTSSRDYTETLAISVVQRRWGEFIALEYIESTGSGDDYSRGPWGGRHIPKMGWTPAPIPASAATSKPVPKKPRGSKLNMHPDTDSKTHFLGAFIAPQPWEALFPEEQWSHEGEVGFPNEPCVWQID